MKTNYILIDYENLPVEDVPVDPSLPVKVIVFLGKTQKKIPVSLILSLQPLGARAEFIEVSFGGKNALDFCLVYELGRLNATDSGQNYYILSSDKAFESLVKNMRLRGVSINRVEGLNEIPLLRRACYRTTKERSDFVAESLRGRSSGLPRNRTTLANSIAHLFRKTLTDDEVDEVVQDLERRCLVSFAGELASYHLTANACSGVGQLSKALPQNASPIA
ncbi:hypothetical protein FYK55_20875 [Roseiconus nitratireducens]|uniref:PIN-like domain-containing protein n=1 Tax=Roseiconus nitratireducens TaxID=2605748 RepID=A0A5M6CZ10_9BACT|nr:PIN domain-containing protein [Roseiconus nitratireducens]KAA5540467.1 hypothetical protein FYK55_20875 [Roseiconus nitratireducens]